ncbi:aldo/keto reductase [Microbacterium sp. p3-SID336]|uniref:aldo/keto reductase n=1 Tax=Microbacterium sp. p3-SID336 TaxID=2916212 RepID=UPI0021A5C7F6|nr:aldo/keto reductase [Microbacterium sp. p3-SID336]MCT1479185.1 aldo/keto reductase [Microbacterium sp. p3-SID336]
MTGTDFRWGILGLGEIAERFAEELPLTRCGRLAAVASRSADRAAAFAHRHGSEGTRAYDSYDELLADPEVDAVYIATVHTEHAVWTARAADASKHILCEKPLTLTPAETMAVHEAARRADVALLEGYMYRHHPQTDAVLRVIADGTIGDLQHVEATYAFRASDESGRLFDPGVGGGAVLDVGGYPASMAQAVVVASGRNPTVEKLTARGALTPGGVDAWTTASAVFDGGVTAHLTCAIAADLPPTVRIWGSLGMIEVPQPWGAPRETATTFTIVRAGEDPRHVACEPAALYALEADALQERAAAGYDPRSAEQDSALAQLLYRWRSEVGVRYPFERDDAAVPTVDRRPLRRRPNAMTYGTVAGTDKPVSRLVLGCDNQTDLVFASVMFDDFFERGGNAFDTAYEYSDRLQQKLLGQWIANRGVRDDVFVVGKGAHTPYCDPVNLESQLLETLDDLQTDHIDLYLLHRDNEDVPVGEFVDVLDRYHALGAIRAFGGSNWSRERFESANEYARRTGKQGFTALSNHFGLAEALALPFPGSRHVTDQASKEWLEESQIPLFSWASQARGFFSRADPDDLSDPLLVTGYYSADNFERLRRCRRLAERLGVTPTAVALAYVLHQRFPTFAIIGPRRLSETRTSAAALELDLDDDTIAWLDLRDG